MIRIAVFSYLLCGGAFIVWQSKRWWRELETSAHKALSIMAETEIPTWVCVALVAIGAAVALAFDLVFWPRAVWLLIKERRKLRRWEEHGDFCHCEDCDSDE